MALFTTQNTYNSVLHVLREHDDESGVLFPDHSPKVYDSVRQRCLAGYVVVTDVARTLKRKRIVVSTLAF